MKLASVPRPVSRENLKAVSYEETTAARQPIPVTVPTPPRPPNHKVVAGLRKPKLSPEPTSSLYNAARSKLRDDIRRDSGLAPSSSTAQDSRTTLGTDAESSASLQTSPSLPQLSFREDTTVASPTSPKRWGSPKKSLLKTQIPPVPQLPFLGIVTEIPRGSFDDLALPERVQFSKRGSMLIGGKKAINANGTGNRPLVGSRRPSMDLLSPAANLPMRVLSADEEALSNKVRFMYEGGAEEESDSTDEIHPVMYRHGTDNDVSANTTQDNPGMDGIPIVNVTQSDGPRSVYRGQKNKTKRDSLLIREQHELAGGMEDWEDVNGSDIDRYGFIIPRQASQSSSMTSGQASSQEPARIQRVSTLLQIASEAPRRQRSKLGRNTSGGSPARSATAMSNKRPSSRTSQYNRPVSSQSSYRGPLNGPRSKLRSATNKLPYNRNRRCMDEAGDMLTLPPGLADVVEHEMDSKVADDLKRRERDREEKWQKMAKVVNQADNRGGGMVFEFDTSSPKVIERTWKGIPDRWRATAWHAFLTASARKRRNSPTDEELKSCFNKLVQQGSPDDVQIDIDVPRTINSHIMFRRRYRGGQRLLFRVLHCLSIYFPETGYVQGMATLAATLLCYFDEEMTFVMLVRLWQVRGLKRLYEPGFKGLTQALEEFERGWLAGGEVSAKLNELEIAPTAYGTRWYLTLFNYSIPFPAQLRVWDVFMLLGDSDSDPPPRPPAGSPDSNATNPSSPQCSPSFNGGLDVLHAVSAALIDGTREILLDSDFESAMKVLTSWIPIRDEELLMRVAKAEWKMHRKKK
ncbi:MAG: hypothetical protein LQ342_001819 [Letrouitia transgressa]|nr:MAG: hypothetical protein LQ342_001819 [Letrouitia transgressa]